MAILPGGAVGATGVGTAAPTAPVVAPVAPAPVAPLFFPARTKPFTGTHVTSREGQ